MTTETTTALQPAFIEHQVPRDRGNVHVRDFAGSGPAFLIACKPAPR